MHNPNNFSSYVAWPGDRPSFHRRGGAGTSTVATYEEEADQGHQDIEFDTDFDRIMRGE